ncbi:MAG TPA: MlaD family protein [Pseudonocardia sp.]|nr:MlaD family protein [Pseudonocardia sp.]
MRNGNLLMRRPVTSGLVILAVAAVATILLFEKSAIFTALRPGETITVQLARQYKLEPYASAVKIAGTKIGVVSSVDAGPDGQTTVALKVNPGTRALLGSEPSATVRATTVLGGAYYVQLHPGGDPAGSGSSTIPVQRTHLPVELDQLLSAVPPDAQHGLQGTTAQLDQTFQAGAGAPLDTLLAHAPDTLAPAGTVLSALRGQNPNGDLYRLVTDLNKTARSLLARPGQLRSVVDSLADTSRVLGTAAIPVDRTIATLPDTLSHTRDGADHLSAMLDTVIDTADDARPSVRELDPLLRRLRPVLADLRPVLSDLEPVLHDAHPLVRDLVPTADEARDVLDDLDGPVLRRVNEPILGSINSRWKGLAPKYPNGGDDGNTFYQELGYMFGHITAATQYQSASSHLLGFQAGAGSTTPEGTGASAQQLQGFLSEMYGAPHQHPSLPLGPRLPGGIPLPDPGLTSPTFAAPKPPVQRSAGRSEYPAPRSGPLLPAPTNPLLPELGGPDRGAPR